MAVVRALLQDLIAAVIDHAPANSQITIMLACEGEQAVVSVRDHGPGIPGYALPGVFERFYSLPRQDVLRGGASSSALACSRLPAE